MLEAVGLVINLCQVGGNFISLSHVDEVYEHRQGGPIPIYLFRDGTIR